MAMVTSVIPTMHVNTGILRDTKDKIAHTLKNFVNVPDDFFASEEFDILSTALPTLITMHGHSPTALCGAIERELGSRLYRVVQDANIEVDCDVESAISSDKYVIVLNINAIDLTTGNPISLSDTVYVDENQRLSIASELDHSININDYLK